MLGDLEMLVYFYVVLHAGEEFGALDVGVHCDLHDLDLFGADQEEQVDLLEQLEPDDVLGLPVVQGRDFLQIFREDQYLAVISEQQQCFVLFGVGAVDDLLMIPFYGARVVVEAMLVEGNEGVDGDDGGFADVLAQEGRVGVESALHFI